MADSFEHALDRCLDRINSGERIEACLADYPQHAAQLEPLLRAALRTRDAYTFTPSAEAKQAARERFFAARERARIEAPRRRRGWLGWATRPVVWGPVLAVVVALLVTFVGVRPALSPGVLPIVPVASASGNFAFMISDDVNAIGDFVSVNATFSQIGLLDAASGKWLQITPEVGTVDLTMLQGDASQQVWRGDIPDGDYRQVFIYVNSISGVLKRDGSNIGIKLPSDKLHVKAPFAVSDNAVTTFTFDLTVVDTGRGNDKDKYLLKPVVGESGASQAPADNNNGGGNDRTGPPRRTDQPINDESKSPKKKD